MKELIEAECCIPALTPPDYFGESVFNDTEMRTRLSKSTYESLKKTIDIGEAIDTSIADEVATVMKQWAVEKGATHYTHWFMPLTNTTAEKHDSFIEVTADGQVIMNFSGKALTLGEPDASSFPSGGLRETARARGYTAWDCTSPAFVKEHTLYIPTAFFSYGGEILDNKAPLLRSVEVLSKQGLRVLRALGNTTSKRIVSTVGPEQEYFLVDKKYYEKRLDLMMTGRTLFGAPSPKSQELDDHYFGILKTRIVEFMHDLDIELWKLGVSAKTKHNEVAPGQHELAVIFNRSSEAADNNMLVMEMCRKVAERHGMVCLLHEKPFAGVNGSGKHINWSLATDDGKNLLDPSDDPSKNAQFLVFLAATLKAVDEYADLLRLSVATAANDHRLGASEAPPAIISAFIGEELDLMVDDLLAGRAYHPTDRNQTNLGVKTISLCTVDKTDRNRTSPFAFTGNKFEFRMCGSSMNIASPCYTLNTVVAETLSEAADILEKATDPDAEAHRYFVDTVRAHRRIIFNGNNYSPEWPKEAERRGLPNRHNTVEAVSALKDSKNVAVFEKMHVLTPKETESRGEIILENYAKQIGIEARTALDMVTREITPAVVDYVYDLTQITYQQMALNVKETGVRNILSTFNNYIDQLYNATEDLKKAEARAQELTDTEEQARFYCYEVLPCMSKLREIVDSIEPLVPENRWPLPSYVDLMFRV
ncbi:glutamine synthetase type III [Oscillospiraceae bacterium HV4-5-C5C]|nr:glutamine synthetase type III [Oscillospiraceae bacterium HV4-5-C5C]